VPVSPTIARRVCGPDLACGVREHGSCFFKFGYHKLTAVIFGGAPASRKRLKFASVVVVPRMRDMVM